MGAFSDIRGVMPNGYKVVYNNDREMFKDNSAKNLFSMSSYYPEGRRQYTYNEETGYYETPPYIEEQVLPNYVTDASYLFFGNGMGDGYLNLQFSNNLKNVSHMFAYAGSSGIGTECFNPNYNWDGVIFPDSIEDASGLFKCCYFGYGRPTNFIRNMPNNLKSLNNTFFHAYYANSAFLPLRDENNNFILDKYENLFTLWKRIGNISGVTSNWTSYANSYYYNYENGWDDRRFFNSTIPDSVEYMNGTFALTSIGIDDWYLASYNNIDFHLPNNLKDASFCFFNTAYLNNFIFNLPDSLTEANYMFASSYSGNFPNQVRLGNGLVNAVGMFAQYLYGDRHITDWSFPQEELPSSLKNAKMMFFGCNIDKPINISRGIEDASYMFAPGAQYDKLYGFFNIEYVIPNTVKNIDFLFANVNAMPNNYTGLFYSDTILYNNFTPGRLTTAGYSTYLNNFKLSFEEGCNLNSLRGVFLGCNLKNNSSINVLPGSVKDISFFMYTSGTYFNELEEENFFNNILTENIENAAWAFCYGYCNHNLNIYMPPNLKNISGMFMNFFIYNSDNYEERDFKVNFIGLENTQVEDASYFLFGASYFNQPITFPNTVKDLSYTFGYCGNFIGEYPVEGQQDNWVFSLEDYPNLEKCDGLFEGCSNFNLNIKFPDSLTTMNHVFRGCSNFNQNIKLPENLISAPYLFDSCSNLDQAIKLPSGLTSTEYMFNNCSNFNFGGESVLDFSYLTNLTNMSYMFYNCQNLSTTIDDDNLRWPPSVREITRLFDQTNITINTFVIPGSITYGAEILSGVTVYDTLKTENGCQTLTNVFSNLSGGSVGTDGNYYFKNIIYDCGNNLNLTGYLTLNNCNVNNIVFQNGNILFYQRYYDWYTNNYTNDFEIGAFIIQGDKFNGNIIFDNIETINLAGGGGLFVSECPNYNQPLSFDAAITRTDQYGIDTINNTYTKLYLIAGEWPGDMNYENDGYLYENYGNYIILKEEKYLSHEWNQLISNYEYVPILTVNLEVSFATDNVTVSTAFNQLATFNDVKNVYNNRNDYPSLYGELWDGRLNTGNYISESYWSSDWGLKQVGIYNCQNFNSQVSYGYGTDSIKNAVYNCVNFNNTVFIPSSTIHINSLVTYCPNFDQHIIFPGSIKTIKNAFVNCKNFGNNILRVTAPSIGEGVENFLDCLDGCSNFNQRLYFPTTIKNAINTFKNCAYFNQEEDLKGCIDASGMFAYCNNFNSNILYTIYSNQRKINLFLTNDYKFNKEIDFNCNYITDAAQAFYLCSNFNSNLYNFKTFKIDFERRENSLQIASNNTNDYSFQNSFFNIFLEKTQDWDGYSNYHNNMFNNQEWMVNNVFLLTNCSYLFDGCSKYNAEIVPDFTNAGFCTNMFRGCTNFNRPINLFEAICLNNAFAYCYNFNQPLVFNSTIRYLGNAFIDCYNLSYIPVFLNGIVIAPNDSYWYNWQYNSQNVFMNCYNLGKDQQGEDYAINFKSIEPGYNHTEYGHSYSMGGLRFFSRCYNLNVPLKIDFLNQFPDYFLEFCRNFNSNIYINRGSSYYSDRNWLSIIGNGVFYQCSNYNKPFILYNNYCIHDFGGYDFFNGCSNYNQPIQVLFDHEIYSYGSQSMPNGYMELTRLQGAPFRNCANFNQPILNYYFDNALKNNLIVQYPSDVSFQFDKCNNFNQLIQGSFTKKEGYWYNDSDDNRYIQTSFPISMTYNFNNCFTPSGVIELKYYDNLNYDRYGASPCNLGLNFGAMKVPNTETNKTMYINYICNVIDSSQESTVNWSLSLTQTVCVYSDWYGDTPPQGYDRYAPENFYIDFYRNDRGPVSLQIYPYSSFYIGDEQYDNYIIENFNWLPSLRNDNISYFGFYNSSSGHLEGRSLFYGVGCDHIDVWNSIFNRNGLTYFYQIKDFLCDVHNLRQDFHFDSDAQIKFNWCDNIFVFGSGCEVNIYINNSDCFNRVNNFIQGSNVNIYIKNDLYFNNSYNFFRSYQRFWDPGGNYYIGENTIFNNLRGGLPCTLKTNLNMEQFICPQGYSLAYGDYVFDATNSTEVDFSNYNLRVGCFKFTNLHTNMLIINQLPYDYNYENAMFYNTKSLFNVKINQYYSGSIYACGIFFLTDYPMSASDITNLRTNNVIDETNTYMRVYVKRGTSLYYQLSNFRNGINIFKNTSYNTRTSKFENYITYTQDSDGIYYYNTSQGIYYNLYWY